MSTIHRRSWQRLAAPDSLADIWDRQLPPPAWAFEPGEHHEELVELAFFGTDNGPFLFAQDHPLHAAWLDAMCQSKED